ncbi:MAG: hypothetical protein HOE90_00105 [Bacteriovoracaceae bacterium]|jgi:hypothetical protein|nr:hypothetical protein [Bacteriovoracaceae bacterium]
MRENKMSKVVEKLAMLGLCSLVLVSCAKKREYDSLFHETKELKKSIFADSSSEYLYLPSTLGTPRNVTSAKPYYQGDEKIVKLKFEENGLVVYQEDPDKRFQDNEQNRSIVLTIPVTYKAYRCSENTDGKCKNEEEENTEIEWQDKDHFIPDFSSVKFNETNGLDLFSVGKTSFCSKEVSQKLVSSEISDGVINFELQKTFTLSSNYLCVLMSYFNDDLENTAFTVKFFYSLIKLDKIKSANYKPVSYPKADYRTFGFFKNKTSVLNGNFEPGRENISFLMNRWNNLNSEGEKGRNIVYHLSDTYNKPENLYLKKATYQVVEKVNDALSRADSGLQIQLHEPSGKNPGDIRNSMIVLIDDPLANGLLGYGPSVKNPRTGEIVQAHTNMYSGVLKTGIRRAYKHMYDLSKEEAKKKKEESEKLDSGDADVVAKNTHPSAEASSIVSMAKEFSRQRLKGSGTFHRFSNNLGEIKKNNLRLTFQQLMQIERSKSKTRDFKSVALELAQDENFTGDNAPNPYDKAIEYENFIQEHAINNAYHIDLFHFAGLAKVEIKGVSQVPGVLEKDGTLKPWSDLNAEQREIISTIVMTHTYSATLLHEIGHNLGLRHNFKGSFDKDNFYTDKEAKEQNLGIIPAYSSIMDYGYSDLNELSIYGKYDIAALRFGYAREVELADGSMASIESTLKELKEEKPTLAMKSFGYCTDENASINIGCSRFDEGTSYSEIAQHYIDSYNALYKRLNWRDERNKFNTFGIENYVGYVAWRFRRMRFLFERYEDFARMISMGFMEQGGCGAGDRKAYPKVCNEVDETIKAAGIIANFFMDVIESPDHLCALAKKGTTETSELKPLRDISIPGTTRASSCFDSEVVESLLAKDLVVKGEKGRYLLDLDENNPKYAEYVNDISVRGIWADKLMAMKYLTTRKNGLTSTEKSRFSLMDVTAVKARGVGILDSILTDSVTPAQKVFQDKDGKEYVEKNTTLVAGAKMISDMKTSIPQLPWWSSVRRRFDLRSNEKYPINYLLFDTALYQNDTRDPLHDKDADNFEGHMTVDRIHSSNHDSIPRGYMSWEDQSKMTIYLAELPSNPEKNKHTIAAKMIETINKGKLIKPLSTELLKKVMKARVELPEGASADETLVFKNFKKAQIESLLKQLISMGDNAPGPDDVADPGLKAIVRLGVKGLPLLLEKMELVGKVDSIKPMPLGDTPTEEEKAAYEKALSDYETVVNLKKDEEGIDLFTITLDILTVEVEARDNGLADQTKGGLLDKIETYKENLSHMAEH